MDPQRRKLGVALSGGGLRAAFFHIGVLAQMARLGVLRHVEVLSTVSGGAILGSLYYLHLKRLLEAKPDSEITDQDYVSLIERIEVDFLKAVERDLRVRSLLNPWKLIQTSLPHISRSDQIGYLYDEYFYRPALDPARTRPVEMRELEIRPKGAPDKFDPLQGNTTRSAKVPVLLINATALNTGHNWRFEAATMGEPERQETLAQEIDKIFRLRRPPSYGAITRRQQDIELGLAVAASSCVPGIFPPLAITGLYGQGIRVRLVDGGVHDNQGIQGLLDLECTHFVVSDASGQMREEADPAPQLVPLLSRATTVLENRVREESLFRLMERQDRPVAFMHLLKGLSAEAVAWLDVNDRPAQAPTEERRPRETFGVPQPVQEALSRVRTDLDAFTEVEAYSLMMDAYLMSEAELARLGELARPPAAGQTFPWRFLTVEPWLRHPTPRYQRRLDVARERHFKLFRLKWPLTVIGLVVLLAFLGWLTARTLSWALIKDWLGLRVPVGSLLLVLVILGLILLPELFNFSRLPAWIRTPAGTAIRFVVRVILAPFVSAVSAVQLGVIGPLFLREGRLTRLGPPPQGKEGAERGGKSG
jgi:NTE family protein